MPLLKGRGNRKKNFHELKHGKTYKHTLQKFGRKKANKQMTAIVLNNERKRARKKRT
jgi:hypothetical protein